MSAQCTSYMDVCVPGAHGVHTVITQHPLSIASMQKSIKSRDKGLFTKKGLLCHGKHWCIIHESYTWSVRGLGIDYSANWLIPRSFICFSIGLPFTHKAPTVVYMACPLFHNNQHQHVIQFLIGWKPCGTHSLSSEVSPVP